MEISKHRSAYRGSAEQDFSHTFVTGIPDDKPDFDPIGRLKELRQKSLPDTLPPNAPVIMHISMYCNKSFPVRIFHVLSLKDGMNSHAVFFKNNFTIKCMNHGSV